MSTTSVTSIDGRTAGYRPSATFGFGTELRRQLRRRRTQLTFGLLALLPVIVAIASEVGRGTSGGGGGGGGNRPGMFSSLGELATGGALNFTLFTVLISSTFLLIVVVALFCGDTVASEASWGSLRYLLAIPVPRARLLAVKFAVGLVASAAALATLAVSALLVGTVLYGWRGLVIPLAGEIAAGEGLLLIAMVMGYLGVTLLPVAGLAFFLSVSTDAPLGAVGGATLVYIVSGIIDNIPDLGVLRDVLPTRYSFSWFGLLQVPAQTDEMVLGAISAVLYAAVFGSLAWWRFLRKDIVS